MTDYKKIELNDGKYYKCVKDTPCDYLRDFYFHNNDLVTYGHDFYDGCNGYIQPGEFTTEYFQECDSEGNLLDSSVSLSQAPEELLEEEEGDGIGEDVEELTEACEGSQDVSLVINNLVLEDNPEILVKTLYSLAKTNENLSLALLEIASTIKE